MENTKKIRCIISIDLAKLKIDILRKQVLSPNSQYLVMDRYVWDIGNNKPLNEFSEEEYLMSVAFSQDSQQLVYTNQIYSDFYLNIYRIKENIEMAFKLKYEPNQIIIRNKNEFIINHEEGFDIYSLNPLQLLKQIKLERIIHYYKEFDHLPSRHFESKNHQFSLRYMANILHMYTEHIIIHKLYYFQIYNPKSLKPLEIIHFKSHIIDILDSVINNWILIRVQRCVYILDISTFRLIKKTIINQLPIYKLVEIKGANYNFCIQNTRYSEDYYLILKTDKLLPEFQTQSDRIILKSKNVVDARMLSSSQIGCHKIIEKIYNIYQF